MHKPEEMDGASMLNILNGKPWRDILDLEHSLIYEPDNAWVALTDGSHKYIYYTLTGQQQLFDLSNDPKELRDVSLEEEYGPLTQQWRGKMIKHLSVRGDSWVSNGDLVIQNESQKFGPNDSRYQVNSEN